MKIVTARLAPCALMLAIAAPAAADQQILDDLIVDGSACVGQDCVNGESFGFDTIRLKENNLRIKFQDTSNSASFPTNDWQLTANDSSNGGLNKFSIDDIDGGRTPFTIEAGARANALYVEADGDVGVGTNNPVVDLHVVSGNTPTLRLDQDGSSGFSPQVWDLAGNEANFFIRDVTNGSRLVFRIQPNAPDASIYIKAPDGDIGAGVGTNPEASLHIRRGGTLKPEVRIESTGANNTSFRLRNTVKDWLVRNNTAGNLVINETTVSSAAELTLTDNGDMTLRGDLITGGTGTCAPPAPACDGVFLPDFEVPTIAEHSAYMWKNSHLKAVGPTLQDTPINLTQKTTGMLHELEVAHIYIEQLHKRLNEVEGRFATLESESVN